MRGEGRERIAERVGRLPGGTERKALRFQVGVFDGQFENAVIELLVFGEMVFEFLQGLDLGGIAETSKAGTKGRDIGGDESLELFGFARESNGGFVGVGHDGAIRRIGCLVELNAELRRPAARLGEFSEHGVRLPMAAGGEGKRDGHRKETL